VRIAPPTNEFLRLEVRAVRPRVERPARVFIMNEHETVPRLRPRRLVPVLGTLVGAAAGFAFYWFFGCDSG
jgi:hypothetical protein